MTVSRFSQQVSRASFRPSFIASFLPSFLPSFLLSCLPPFLVSFLPSLPSFPLPSCLLPSFPPSLPPRQLPRQQVISSVFVAGLLLFVARRTLTVPRALELCGARRTQTLCQIKCPRNKNVKWSFRICQIKCQTHCQVESEKICQNICQIKCVN